MRTRFFSFFLTVLLAAFALPVQAQTPAGTTGSISGSVVTADGVPVANAQVSLEGAHGPAGVRTAADGSFTLTGIAPGIYSIVITRSGFDTANQTGIAVVGGGTVNVKVSLVQSSFSSLRVIGSTSTTAGGKSQINTSSAAVSTITSQAFLDQGASQIQTLLNETPGIVTTHIEENGASEGSDEEVQIRGGLPYETQSLIDGHPLSIGASGNYNPILLSPYLLQNIQVIKGPGSFGTEINGAINGTVNYRTLEPTSTPQQSVTLESDQYGGVTTVLKATGSLKSHFIDYALGYSTNGTPGQYNNYQAYSSTLDFDYLGGAPYSINGQQLAEPTNGFLASTTPQYIGYPGEIRYSQPLYFCCQPLNIGFHQTNELAKIRLNISQQTAVTISYLGGADEYDGNGSQLQYFTGGGIQFFNFIPPAGYAGSIPVGSSAYFDDNANLIDANNSQTGLFQTELRSAIGPVTLLARYYSSFETDLSNQPNYDTTNLRAWGGISLCPAGDTATLATATTPAFCTAPGGGTVAPTETFYNGTPVTIGGTGGDPFIQLNTDHSRGESFEFDLPSGANTYSVSFDRSNHDSTEYLDATLDGINGYQLSPGSGQQETTVAAKAQLELFKNVSATIGDYFIGYKSHYSGDGGATFADASQTYNAPRFALVDRANADTSIRFSLGASIAPPYISLLSAPAGQPVPNIPAAPNYYTENVNNGQVKPETAFGYDLGIDRRLAPRITFQGDVYLTNLRNSFLSQTYQDGTYTATQGAAIGQTEPLFITETSNLGQSRYEGIEAAVSSDPAAGLGFKVQGSLMRAYPYNVPNSLYATSSGAYSTNLAVIPNVNYEPSIGIGFNGVGGTGGRVPYSQGYGELNYRKKKWYGNLDVTYYGPNNTFNNPAFGVVSGTLRYQINKGGSLQFSGYNITQAYSTPYYDFFGGVPVPLVNGSHGATAANLGTTESGNIGPATYRLIFTQALGH